MATVVRNTEPGKAEWVAALNDLRAQIGAASSFHLDKSEVTITAADSTSLATALVLVNQILAVFNFHKADTLAHKVVDATAVAAPKATDLTTAQTLANELKADYNVHIASTTYHYNADATNGIAAADATNQATLDTLLNEIKTDFNAHMASGPVGKSVRLVSA